ncbi:MAG: HAMP domain-containing histidine kinase [Clostridia bacterium]|nr:HAMP domain-containing histidine kinase [Clostridia bacterium]
MKIKLKQQKPTLLKSPAFSAAIVAGGVVIACNILYVFGLYFVMTSPKYNIYSRVTIISMAVVCVLNVIVLALLIILRKYYERRALNSIIVPLQQIEAHIEKLVEGEYDLPIRHISNDEIGDLFQAVEDVRIKLKDYHAQELKNVALKRVHISGLMHDIATPVTRINGFASLVADGIVTDVEEIKRFASMVLQSTEDINIMLKSIAAAEQYNKTETATKRQPVDLGEVLEKYIFDLSLELSLQDVSISFDNCCKNAAVCSVDIKHCKRVLHNLINNSIKYKKPDERCKILIKLEDYPDGRILCSVSDNGIGVEPGTEEMLFEMFYRGDGARRNINEGNGLGLFLCKQILLANDAEISAENKDNGLTINILFHRSDEIPVRWYK